MNTTHRNFPTCAALALAAMTLGIPPQIARADHAQPFTEGTFANTDWTVTNFGNRTATVTQVAGGLSGTARQVTHPLNGTSNVQACHLYNSAQLNPANGAIQSLDFSIQAKFISGVGVNGHQVGLALIQSGVCYRAGSVATGTSGNWVQLSLSGLTSADFTRFDGQPGNPDFSTSGAPISFGFRTGNGNAGQSINQIVLYDDFSIVVHRGSLIVSVTDPSAADWDEWLSTTGSGGTFTMSGPVSGGNPGTCQSLAFGVNAGTSSIEVLQFSNDPAGTFDPQFGTIANIEFSMDLRSAPNASASSMTINLLFEQAGVFYRGPDMSSGTSQDWHTIQRRNLVPANFKRNDGLAGLPDFSTTGQPIRVGRRVLASHGAAGGNVTLKQYVDNFYVRAHFTACPCDLTGDNLVDDADFTMFLRAYNILDCSDPDLEGWCGADFNGDGFVDDTDFQQFVVAYDQLVCP
ncbi:MAG: dockerin type I repeat-containing protein [Phycisphaerales bacterium]|nr:dockerin type I repeat-containing protein [Planctomycetota bacterium]